MRDGAELLGVDWATDWLLTLRCGVLVGVGDGLLVGSALVWVCVIVGVDWFRCVGLVCVLFGVGCLGAAVGAVVGLGTFSTNVLTVGRGVSRGRLFSTGDGVVASVGRSSARSRRSVLFVGAVVATVASTSGRSSV